MHSKNENQYYAEAFETSVCEKLGVEDLPQLELSCISESDMRKIEAMFDSAVGIPNANTDKRERLVTDEVNANNVSTYSLLSMWIENLQESCKRIHSLFGIGKSEIWFDWRFPPEMNNGGDMDASGTVDARTADV